MGDCNFEIVKITQFNEEKKMIHLETKEAHKDKGTSWFPVFSKPKSRWLHFDDTSDDFGSSDSKRFLFLLMEHYLFNGSGVHLFDISSTDGAKTWLRSQKREVMDWITAHCDCKLGKWAARHPDASEDQIRRKGEQLMRDHEMQRCDKCSDPYAEEVYMTGTYKPRPTYGIVNAAQAKYFKTLSGITTMCPKCQGWGCLTEFQKECKDTKPDWECLYCNGTGKDLNDRKCGTCKGTGKTTKPAKESFGCPPDARCQICTCLVCGGEGAVDAKFDLTKWEPTPQVQPANEPDYPSPSPGPSPGPSPVPANTGTTLCPEGELAQWTAAEVGQFIKSLGKAYEKYASEFSDNCIEGKYLINNDLEETFDILGIENKIHRIIIRRKIKDRTNMAAADQVPTPVDNNNDGHDADTTWPIRDLSKRTGNAIPQRNMSDRTPSSQSAVSRRRIAEDNVQPSVVLCAWILALIVGMAVFLLDRHATIAKRDAIQRGHRNCVVRSELI